jgi:hypothetical protein
VPDISRVWTHPGDHKPRRQIVNGRRFGSARWFSSAASLLDPRLALASASVKGEIEWPVVISPRSGTAINISRR